MIEKLEALNLNNNVVCWIKNFLTNREQFVALRGVESNIGGVTSGVPQGAVLSPILFNIFINDFFQLPLRSLCLAYADDVKLCYPCMRCDDLQSGVDCFAQW